MTPVGSRVEPIHRGVDVAEHTSVSVAAYPPDDSDSGWSFQANVWMWTGGAQTSFSISGLHRERVEALRDALNVLLTETQP